MHFDYDLERVKVGAQRDVAAAVDDDDDDDDDESFSIVINQIGAAAILYTTPLSRINDGRTDGWTANACLKYRAAALGKNPFLDLG